jgi:hypothetical protein
MKDGNYQETALRLTAFCPFAFQKQLACVLQSGFSTQRKRRDAKVIKSLINIELFNIHFN